MIRHGLGGSRGSRGSSGLDTRGDSPPFLPLSDVTTRTKESGLDSPPPPGSAPVSSDVVTQTKEGTDACACGARRLR